MASRPTRSVIFASAVLLAAAAGAAARAAPPVDPSFAHQNDFTPNQLGPQPQASHQVLQWDARKGRWGLNFDLNQQPNRNADWRDARIGLNYRVAPGLRTGVGVSLGNESPPDVRTFAPEQPAPRVRLETTLKF